MDNRILPLPERARKQTPRGIGQLPEQTLRNPSRIDDDKTASSPGFSLDGYTCPGLRFAHPGYAFRPRGHIEILRFSPISGRVPVTAAAAIFTYETMVPGESQYSASSGVTFRTRMFGSSALSHLAFAGVENNSLILARSLETTAVPVNETYFWAEASAKLRIVLPPDIVPCKEIGGPRGHE